MAKPTERIYISFAQVVRLNDVKIVGEEENIQVDYQLVCGTSGEIDPDRRAHRSLGRRQRAGVQDKPKVGNIHAVMSLGYLQKGHLTGERYKLLHPSVRLMPK
jgi:hypothetical protein